MPDDNNQPASAMTAAGRYAQLETLRSPALMRGRECAALTIPALLPPEGTNDTSQLPTPYQSVGARGTNNLSSKLLLALFPPGASFFRLKVEEFLMDKLKERAGAGNDPTAEIETALSKIERAVITRLEQRAVRPVLSEFFKHLIVVGNALLQVLDDGALKSHTLANYVVKRDVAGSPLEIIVREGLSKKTLPPLVKAIVDEKTSKEGDEQKDTADTIWLYTWVQRQDNGSWKVHQEVLATVVEGTQGTYPKDKSAWIASRWTAI